MVALHSVNNKNHSKPSDWSGSINYGVFNLLGVMMVWREWEKLKAGPLSRDFYDGRSCRPELKGQTQHFLPPPPKVHDLVMWLQVFTSP